MCGIVGIVGSGGRNVNQDLYDALTVLQHRGQDAAGIVTCENGQFHQRKSNGLVRDVFQPEHMPGLRGSYGIAHVRYPTAGSSSPALAQPFYVNAPFGIALSHNGNLTNSEELARYLQFEEHRHLNTDSDSEILLNVFASELARAGSGLPTAENIFTAVERVHELCEGAYAVVGTIAGHGVFAFRDPNGIRPLVIGKRLVEDQTEYMIASESVALDVLEFGFVPGDDVLPGEAVFISRQGEFSRQQCHDSPQYRPCMFEHVYFARPDSFIDGISVYKSRVRMGQKLAAKIKRDPPPDPIDVVIPIPESSRTSAQVLAHELGIKFSEGFVKNRYIGRTFIMPGQQQRKKSVRQKLNPINLEFQDKNVLLVDDSIVRGTTCEQIIQMARDAGALKVFFASAAPQVKFPNVYGIDMPSARELIANGKTLEEIRLLIHADWLVYQDLDDLKACLSEGNQDIREFEASVFDGQYVVGDVDQEYLRRLEEIRNDYAKQKKERERLAMELALVGIYNH